MAKHWDSFLSHSMHLEFPPPHPSHPLLPHLRSCIPLLGHRCTHQVPFSHLKPQKMHYGTDLVCMHSYRSKAGLAIWIMTLLLHRCHPIIVFPHLKAPFTLPILLNNSVHSRDHPATQGLVGQAPQHYRQRIALHCTIPIIVSIRDWGSIWVLTSHIIWAMFHAMSHLTILTMTPYMSNKAMAQRVYTSPCTCLRVVQVGWVGLLQIQLQIYCMHP